MLKEMSLDTNIKPTWCPGCGNYGIYLALKKALKELSIPQHEVLVTYGIGCHGHLVNFLNTYGFEGLHGRPLPLAQGVKLTNHDLTVVVSTGDGDCLGEGGNHFIHACRRNINITCIIHDNQIYGLTTGQISPTSKKNHQTKSTPFGNLDLPLSPVALALIAHASFVARAYSGDMNHLSEVLQRAIKHRGFAVVDVMQPCVVFNKINTYDYFQKRVYKLGDRGEEVADWEKAMQLALEWPPKPGVVEKDKIPLGVIYQDERPTLEDQLPQLKEQALVKQDIYERDLGKILKQFT